jgi:hypothetical protein
MAEVHAAESARCSHSGGETTNRDCARICGKYAAFRQYWDQLLEKGLFGRPLFGDRFQDQVAAFKVGEGKRVMDGARTSFRFGTRFAGSPAKGGATKAVAAVANEGGPAQCLWIRVAKHDRKAPRGMFASDSGAHCPRADDADGAYRPRRNSSDKFLAASTARIDDSGNVLQSGGNLMRIATRWT